MKRVLIIDDSPSMIAVLEHLFKTNGFETVSVDDGEKGVDEVKKSSFDLVVTDTNLPGIDGYEVCTKVKEIDPALRVLMMTGTVNHDIKIKAAKHKADEMVDKSKNIEQVVEMSKMILGM